ncbi:MAG: hypothetical protein GDA55_07995 [Cellvibrionales bacterium]|nr:hypothetical protein [Cellvibrionales bacterium]
MSGPHPPSRPNTWAQLWPLYIIVGTVALTLALGQLLSPQTEEGKLRWVDWLGTTNHGRLLNPPIEVTAGQLRNADGTAWAGLQDNRWKLLVLYRDACAAACQQRLAQLQAMRIRLNTEAHRLSIGALAANTTAAPPNLDATPPDLPNPDRQNPDRQKVASLQITDPDLVTALHRAGATGLDSGPLVLLMNPPGDFILAYSNSHPALEIFEDFEHLLDLAR